MRSIVRYVFNDTDTLQRIMMPEGSLIVSCSEWATRISSNPRIALYVLVDNEKNRVPRTFRIIPHAVDIKDEVNFTRMRFIESIRLPGCDILHVFEDLTAAAKSEAKSVPQNSFSFPRGLRAAAVARDLGGKWHAYDCIPVLGNSVWGGGKLYCQIERWMFDLPGDEVHWQDTLIVNPEYA